MKKTIYILHGWAVRSGNLNQQKWQAFFTELKNYGLETVFLKIPGLSTPLSEVWELDDFVEWLRTQLPKNQAVILLGHSFGGQIATRFTAKYPERVRTLILVDSAGIRDMSVKAVIKRTVFLWLAKLGKLFFKSRSLRSLLYKLAGERDYKDAPPLLRRTMSKVLDDEVIQDMKQITVPTKIVWGESDTVTPVKDAYLVKQLIKNSELSLIKGAKHSPQFTHYQQTAKVIGEFLR